jgi:DNA-directed RNA polymerase subunit E'/Rpb7
MASLKLDDIYFYTTIKKRISLNPRYLDENFTAYIEKIIKNTIEGRCIKEGYVVPNTVIILKRSIGNMNNNQFNGNVVFDVTIGAKICNIPVNCVIKANIKKLNKLGILAELGPLMIIVPKEIHQNKEPFKDINIGDEIDLLVIGKTFNLNSKIISVYAKLNSEAKKKITIQVRKGVDKHKNMNKFTASESIIPEDTDIIESDSDVDIDDEIESENEDSNSDSGSESNSENLDDIDELGEVDEELDDDLDDKQIQIDEVESLNDEDEDDEDDEDDEGEDEDVDVDDE